MVKATSVNVSPNLKNSNTIELLWYSSATFFDFLKFSVYYFHCFFSIVLLYLVWLVFEIYKIGSIQHAFCTLVFHATYLCEMCPCSCMWLWCMHFHCSLVVYCTNIPHWTCGLFPFFCYQEQCCYEHAHTYHFGLRVNFSDISSQTSWS